MQRHVILFARTPRYGCVKTRLARDIGKIETLRFYRNTVRNVIRRLAHTGKFTFATALTPGIGTGHDRDPLFKDMPVWEQGHGDLGQRMARIFSLLPDGPALIIGSDIPAIAPHHIARAFGRLGSSDAVFGPSSDGGYWLVGLKRRASPPPGFMQGVRWSSPYALQDTLATLPKHWKVSYIDILDDIDDGTSFKAWAAMAEKTGTGRTRMRRDA